MFRRNAAYNRFVPIAPHASESIEVIMCTHGTNRYYMADAIIDLRPGDVLIIAPGAQQATGIFTAECVNRMMRIRRLALKERMSAILDGKGVVSELLRHSTKGFSDSWCVVHMGEDLNRSSLMELLENTPARPEPDTILFENSLMVAFFSQLQLQYADRAELHLSDSSSQEKALIDCLRREFGHITKQELAARYSYSERQVLRIVQKHTGLSFQDCIKQMRLDYIANQLITTDLPILQIIESAGYANNNVFYNHFGERFGQTPSQYRSQRH